jgi:hypothetical protein
VLTLWSGMDGYRLAFDDGQHFEVLADRLTWDEARQLYRSAVAVTQPGHLRRTVAREIEALLDRASHLIAVLDVMEGDPDLEEACEDEGAQCDDEGADGWLGAI